MFVFGSGVLMGVRTDVANATPVNFGLVQEVSPSMKFDQKELYGQYQFPVAVARGKGKFGLKAKLARVSGLVMASLFLGQSLTSGMLTASIAEAHAVPASSPYTVTVTNSAEFVDDYGVVYAATGLPLTKVASGPTQGQYSVSAGVYTFAAADDGAAVLISYTYTVTGTTSQQVTVTNQLMGQTPLIQAQFYTSFQGVPMSAKFYNVIPTGLDFATKLDDFMIPDMEMGVQANAAGQLCNFSFGEVS